jgi:hypothetical protein
MAALVVVQGDPVRHDAHYDDGRYPDNEIADEKEGREGQPCACSSGHVEINSSFRWL